MVRFGDRIFLHNLLWFRFMFHLLTEVKLESPHKQVDKLRFQFEASSGFGLWPNEITTSEQQVVAGGD
jgi:hypothetical protein